MLTNGSTAMECGGGAKAVDAASGDGTALDAAADGAEFDIHGLLMSK
jgi:hypothetical protein